VLALGPCGGGHRDGLTGHCVMTGKRSGPVDPPDRSPALGNQACRACYPWRSQGPQRHVRGATAPLRVYGGRPGARQGYGNAAEDPAGRPGPRQPQSLALAPAVRTFPAVVFGACVSSSGRHAGWPEEASHPLKTRRGAMARIPNSSPVAAHAAAEARLWPANKRQSEESRYVANGYGPERGNPWNPTGP